MTNLEVLRAVQHSWPQYCWPFAANVTGYSLSSNSPPSPPSIASMNTQESSNPNAVMFKDEHKPGTNKRSHSHTTPTLNYAPHNQNKTNGVKNERLTPDYSPPSSLQSSDHLSVGSHVNAKHSMRSTASVTPSPSASPKSQSSNRTRTPSSFSGTPPHPGFTSPIPIPPGCISPAALGTLPPNMALLAARGGPPNFMDTQLPRNCSDIMRSLAAKYNNNNNNNTNNHAAAAVAAANIEFFNSQLVKSFNRLPMNPLLMNKGGFPTANVDTSMKTSQSIEESSDQHSTKSSKLPPPPLLPTNTNSFPQSPINTVSSTQALLDMVRNASTVSQHTTNPAVKRPADSSSPLDLSSSVSTKRPKIEQQMSPPENSVVATPPSSPPHKEVENILSWTVEDVCNFIKNIDLCAEYADIFREHRIDGWCLSLLTETHLTSTLNMKLGPALKLRSIILSSSRAAGVSPSCVHCNHHPGNSDHEHQHLVQPHPPSSTTTTSSTTATTHQSLQRSPLQPSSLYQQHSQIPHHPHHSQVTPPPSHHLHPHHAFYAHHRSPPPTPQHPSPPLNSPSSVETTGMKSPVTSNFENGKGVPTVLTSHN